jgi:hypothetical protein
MAQPNFSSLLDAAPTEIDRPKPVPQGSYLCVVKGLPRYDKSAKKGTEFTEFTLQPVQAFDDVDMEALKEMGGLEDKTFKATFYHTEGSIYRLDEFHEHCGIDLDPKVSRRERSESANGCQVGAYIKHVASQDGSAIYANIGKTFKVE